MFPKEPTRSYNPISLEKWFDYIQIDWEEMFSEEVLLEARKLYLSGEVKGIELSVDAATIHYAFTRKDIYYSIVDWIDGAFKVRSSTSDSKLGNIIAAAGLYEIEELVADEISPIAIEADQKKHKGSNAHKAKKSGKNQARAKQGEQNAQRKLVLEFFGSDRGLTLKTSWLDKFGNKDSVFASESEAVSETEREKIVQLTVLTREIGFRFRKEKEDFFLSDFERIAGFFSHAKKRWESIFGSFVLDSGAEEMAQGLKKIEILGRAETAGRSKMRMDYQFRLGSELMDFEDAQYLTKYAKGTHFIKGKGIISIQEEQSKAIKNWEISFDKNKLQEWPRYMLYSLWLDKGIQFDLAGELKRWRDRLLKNNKKHEDFQSSLPDFLREYQAEGVAWMQHMFNNGGHCLLADEMGLGKTLQVLTLIAHCAEFDQSSMIVCPASVVPVWKMEIERWYPNLRVEILKSDHLPKREKGVLWLSSYSLLRRHVDQVKSVTFEYLILDEAQCIKNPLAKVSQACYSLDGKFRLAITGTPIENKLLDIWSIFNFLMPGLMGSMQEFEAALQSGNASWVSEFSDHVKKQISPFILRRLKERVAQELPAKTEVDLICPIKGQQKTLYNAFLNKELALINDESGKVIEQKGFSLFTLLTRLRQVCCDPGIIPDLDFDAEESGKVIVLLSRLYEAFDGIKKRKVVIFSQFVKLIDRLNPILKKHFPDLNIYELTGSTRDRSQPVREFQEDANSAIILVSLKAGGTGVTLNSADYLFLMDPWWNPAVENQAIDRVHRMGQKMSVFIYRMITKGTIEERIQLLKSEKREIFDATFKDVNLVKDIHEYFGNLTNLVALDNTESKETSAVKELIK